MAVYREVLQGYASCRPNTATRQRLGRCGQQISIRHVVAKSEWTATSDAIECPDLARTTAAAISVSTWHAAWSPASNDASSDDGWSSKRLRILSRHACSPTSRVPISWAATGTGQFVFVYLLDFRSNVTQAGPQYPSNMHGPPGSSQHMPYPPQFMGQMVFSPGQPGQRQSQSFVYLLQLT